MSAQTEILNVLANSTEALTSREIREQCASAFVPKTINNTLLNMRAEKLIIAVESSEPYMRFVLAPGIAATLPKQTAESADADADGLDDEGNGDQQESSDAAANDAAADRAILAEIDALAREAESETSPAASTAADTPFASAREALERAAGQPIARRVNPWSGSAVEKLDELKAFQNAGDTILADFEAAEALGARSERIKQQLREEANRASSEPESAIEAMTRLIQDETLIAKLNAALSPPLEHFFEGARQQHNKQLSEQLSQLRERVTAQSLSISKCTLKQQEVERVNSVRADKLRAVADLAERWPTADLPDAVCELAGSILDGRV